MKKHNNWWIEDEENFHKVFAVLENESFSCVPVLDTAFRYVKNFNVAIDIGTWIGDSTSIMCDKFSWVWCFEANHKLFDCCNQNLQDRNYTNFALLNYAVSNTRNKQDFFTGKKSSSGGWIGTNATYERQPQYSVPCRRLDDFNFLNIDFLKIDVDSHEGFLLLGCEKFFQKNSPTIALEFKETLDLKMRQDKDIPNPLEMLSNWGYTIKEKVGNNDYILTRD